MPEDLTAKHLAGEAQTLLDWTSFSKAASCTLQETAEEELDYDADEVMDGGSAPAKVLFAHHPVRPLHCMRMLCCLLPLRCRPL